MQVVILAGGLGTRLGPLTRHTPKPMVPVNGAPYLEHQLRLLARQSLTDVVLLTGYLGGQIEEWFGDGHGFGLQVRYSREAEPLGTAGALRQALPLLASEFFLIYGDSYLPIDYRGIARPLRTTPARASLAVYNDPDGATTGVRPNIALTPFGAVRRYDKHAAGDRDLTYVDAGVLALRREVVDLVPPTGAASLEEQIFPALIARGWLFAVPTAQRFYDMGTPDRLAAIEAILA